MNSNSKNIDRRKFLESTALAGIAGIAAGAMLTSCKKPDNISLGLPPILKGAPKGRKLKAGLIGAGNRGTGAALNFIGCGPDLELVAIADVFQDKIDNCRERFAKYKMNIPAEKCFVGLIIIKSFNL